MPNKNFKIENGLEVGDRNVVTPDGVVTLPAGTFNLVPAPSINLQTGTSYTLVLSDANNIIEMNNSSANTVTIPENSSVAFPIATTIDVVQVGTGQVSFVPASGVQLRATPGVKITDQWTGATLIKRATNEWIIIGNLSV